MVKPIQGIELPENPPRPIRSSIPPIVKLSAFQMTLILHHYMVENQHPDRLEWSDALENQVSQLVHCGLLEIEKTPFSPGDTRPNLKPGPALEMYVEALQAIPPPRLVTKWEIPDANR